MSGKSKNSNYASGDDTKLKKELSKLKKELDLTRGKCLSSDKLSSEESFLEYINLLKFFAKRYAVFVAVSDTPCGSAFTDGMAVKFMEIGFNTNLSGMFRHSYAAAINAGELICEAIAPSTEKPVEYDGIIEGTPVKLLSIGFNVPQNDAAKIIIDGENHSIGGRGLNFVVFDMVTKSLIDSVNFDTFSDNFPCCRPSKTMERLLHYSHTHPEVSILCFNLPKFPDSDLSDNEKFILQNAVGRSMILQNSGNPIFAINKYFTSSEDIVEVLNAPRSYHNINGVRRFEDTCGKCVNISGGHRTTVGQPKQYERTIYIVGGCHIFGVGCSDKGTIASHLQRLLNEFSSPESKFIVQNYGFYLAEVHDAQNDEEIQILESLPVNPGDIVLLNFWINGNFPCVNMFEASKRPHDYGEIFFDTRHRTEDGNRMVADILFEKLKQENFFSDMRSSPHKGSIPFSESNSDYPGLDSNMRKELEEYKKILVEFYDSMFGMTIGSVVVNCNPFTLGHRHLIEHAASQVDHLMIIVVQENRSVFPFEDRLKLVDEGVTDLKNVTVIPGGKFIISSLTFSDYFNKSEIQDRVIDSSLDVTLFAKEIAPCLNISVRFVGEEPFDNVTRQYNDTLRAILPQHGIQFVEIPRKETNGIAISASHVRKLLDDRNFDEISKIVPKTTFDYLMRRF